MLRLARSIAVAALAGVVACLPLLAFVAGAFEWLGDAQGVIAAPFVLICPPWEMFWALMAHPSDKLLFLRICGLVVLSNALLFAPLGGVYLLASRFGPLLRCSVTGAALIGLLCLGHLYFLAHT
jgi:hypothetical protein